MVFKPSLNVALTVFVLRKVFSVTVVVIMLVLWMLMQSDYCSEW